MPQFPANINLASLNGRNGFRINGETTADLSGVSVSSAGDVNGDGFDDLIIGASRADPNGSASGASYVVFGKAGGFAANLNLSALNGRNGFQINGEFRYDYSGISVSSAGDVNGDGFDDVIVGARGADPNGSLSGASYVVFGKAGGFSANFNLSSLNGSNGFQINGANRYDGSGISVSSAGDVNGDGFDDLIVGANNADPNGANSGASYVVFGKAAGFAANLNLSSLNGGNGFRLSGESQYDNSGISVSSAGDVNGDGFDDLIIGADRNDPHGSESGSSYVVFGKARGFNANLNLSSLNGSNGFRMNGEASYDNSGNSVSAAGDVNGDGFDDVIIGAVFADPNGVESGASYVVFGKAGGFAASLNLSSLNGTNGFQMSGVSRSDHSGISVSSAGDVNGDSFDDVIVGADRADPNGADSGASYVIFGKAGGFSANINLSSLNGNNGFRISGVSAGDNSGGSVSSAGDVNSDGFDDLIIGAVGANPNGAGSGASYVVFGHRPLTAVTILGTGLSQTINGGRGGDSISGLDGNDRLIGWEADDNLAGGAGNDIVQGGIGADTLRGDSGNDIILGGAHNDILTGGDGNDRFKYNGIQDTGDRINDFQGGGAIGGDTIDLSSMDAIPGGGDDPFLFGGTTPTAHGVWYSVAPTRATLFVDTDGDTTTAELTVVLTGVTVLDQGDFVL